MIDLVFMGKYYTYHHMHVCKVDEIPVLFDLKEAEYFILTRQHSNLLWSLLYGFEGTINNKHTDEHNQRGGEIAQILLKKEVLTQDLLKGKTRTHISLPLAEHDFFETGRSIRPTLGYMVNSFISSVYASLEFCRRGIDTIVSRVKSRKVNRHRTSDLEKTLYLFALFNHLRPLYGRSNDCLCDPLALLEFLSRYSTYTDWVYGDTKEPFRAHCRIQQSTTVFNGSSDSLRPFKTIMIV